MACMGIMLLVMLCTRAFTTVDLRPRNVTGHTIQTISAVPETDKQFDTDYISSNAEKLEMTEVPTKTLAVPEMEPLTKIFEKSIERKSVTSDNPVFHEEYKKQRSTDMPDKYLIG